MAGGEFDVTIEAPVDRVWPWVADLGKHKEWSPKPYTVEWISGEPNAVGSRFRSIGWIPGDKDHANEGEIVENQPQSRFGLRASDKQGSYLDTFTLTARGRSTDVTFRLEMHMNGVNAFVVPLVFPLVGAKDIRARMVLLKDKVEGEAKR